MLKPYQTERLTAFLNPSSNFAEIKEKESKTGEPDPRYQLAQSKIAIGSGQKTGRGSAGPPTQLTGNYLPEDDTDFVFAAVGEQYGFLGAGLVLCLYGLLIWRTLRILVMSKDLFGTLIAGGVAAMLMFQVFVNVGMTIGIMPITGVTLPLMSYGGSSVITTLFGGGPAAINLCSGTCFSGAEGPRADLLTDTMSANYSRSPVVQGPPRILLRPSPAREQAGIDTERLDHIEKASACQRRSRGDRAWRSWRPPERPAPSRFFGLHQIPQAQRRPGGRLSHS